MNDEIVTLDCSPILKYVGKITPYNRLELPLLNKFCKPGLSRVLDRWLTYVEVELGEVVVYEELVMLLSYFDTIIATQVPYRNANLISYEVIAIRHTGRELEVDIKYTFEDE